MCRSFEVISSRNDEENKQCANRWKSLIKCLIAGNKITANDGIYD